MPLKWHKNVKNTHEKVKRRFKFRKIWLSNYCCHGQIKTLKQFNVAPNYYHTNVTKCHEYWWRFFLNTKNS